MKKFFIFFVLFLFYNSHFDPKKSKMMIMTTQNRWIQRCHQQSQSSSSSSEKWDTKKKISFVSYFDCSFTYHDDWYIFHDHQHHFIFNWLFFKSLILIVQVFFIVVVVVVVDFLVMIQKKTFSFNSFDDDDCHFVVIFLLVFCCCCCFYGLSFCFLPVIVGGLVFETFVQLFVSHLKMIHYIYWSSSICSRYSTIHFEKWNQNKKN